MMDKNNFNMFQRLSLVLLFAFTLLSFSTQTVLAKATKIDNKLRLYISNTASGNGLIKYLAKAYEREYPDVKVQITVSGGLTVLEQGRLGKADMIITHLPASEKLFIAEGYGVSRTLLMYNDFLFLGPPEDKLELRGERDMDKVLRKIAEAEVAFFVPSKRSGTYKKLDELWLMTGINPDWIGYESTGASSEATLRTAAEFGGFAFVDFGTYLANRDFLNGRLIPVYRDHVALRNYYSAIIVNKTKFKDVNQELAEKFLDFLVSSKAQNLIRTFSEEQFGAMIFVPAASMDIGLQNRKVQQQLEQRSQTIRTLSISIITLTILIIGIIALYLHTRKLGKKHRISEERFELAVTGSSDGIWDWQIDTDVTYFSPRLNKLLGRNGSMVNFHKFLKVLGTHTHPLDADNILDQLQQYLKKNEKEIFYAEFRLNLPHHNEIWVAMRGKALRDSAGNPIRMSGSITDITGTVKQKAEIEYQALHDSLTQLPNRVLLLDRVEQAIRNSSRSNQKFAVIMMDLNRFKEINDTLGHPIGDEVLKEVAERLKKILRKSDTIARMGGDEFALLLPDANEIYAHHTTQKILLALKHVIELDKHKMYIGASLGISIFPTHGNNTHTLIQHADIAMYVAKRDNTGCVTYDANQNSHSIRRFKLEKDLQDAIHNDSLLLNYQPKIDLRTKTVAGVEALLRWNHPELGMIPPTELIEIAEQTGFIKQLTNWILEAVTKQQAQWLKEKLELPVAVNLSTLNIRDPNIIEQIKRCIRQWNIPPHLLELEITESAMMADLGYAVQILEQLDNMGIKLAIDDFGTGFSSLSYLKRLPVAHLKIDRSFVMGMNIDKNDASIVRSTIELAHNMELNVIAEGVEDKAILDKLAILGCDMAQGYYFAKPLPAAALINWLNTSPWGFSLNKNKDIAIKPQNHNILH